MPLNSTHYVVLCPQNDDCIVTIVFVTSLLHPLYRERKCADTIGTVLVPSLGWPFLVVKCKCKFFKQNTRKQCYQTALGNCYGLKFAKCWFQLKNKFIVSFIVIFGTLLFPSPSRTSGVANPEKVTANRRHFYGHDEFLPTRHITSAQQYFKCFIIRVAVPTLFRYCKECKLEDNTLTSVTCIAVVDRYDSTVTLMTIRRFLLLHWNV